MFQTTRNLWFSDLLLSKVHWNATSCWSSHAGKSTLNSSELVVWCLTTMQPCRTTASIVKHLSKCVFNAKVSYSNNIYLHLQITVSIDVVEHSKIYIFISLWFEMICFHDASFSFSLSCFNALMLFKALWIRGAPINPRANRHWHSIRIDQTCQWGRSKELIVCCKTHDTTPASIKLLKKLKKISHSRKAESWGEP